MRRPSGLTATDQTAVWCPVSRWMGPGFEVPDRDGIILGPRDDSPPVGLTATEFTAFDGR